MPLMQNEGLVTEDRDVWLFDTERYGVEPGEPQKAKKSVSMATAANYEDLTARLVGKFVVVIETEDPAV